jgi:hypothetical protein
MEQGRKSNAFEDQVLAPGKNKDFVPINEMITYEDLFYSLAMRVMFCERSKLLP